MSCSMSVILRCPFCQDTFKPPILQCKSGHSACSHCVTRKNNKKKICRECNKQFTETRNYQLEQIVQTSMLRINSQIKIPCKFANRGCKLLLPEELMLGHITECKRRIFNCEWHTYTRANCAWTGNYEDIKQHFFEAHNDSLEYKTEMDLNLFLDREHRDVRVISFFNGAQFFYYKHRIDPKKQKIYFTFQFIGGAQQAMKYYYEFEINSEPIRKFKVTEICQNDVVDAEKIFEENRCVVLSFAQAKSFMNDNLKLPIKFRIMMIKKQNHNSE